MMPAVCLVSRAVAAGAALAAVGQGLEDPSPWIGILGVPEGQCASHRSSGRTSVDFGTGASRSCFDVAYDKWIQMAGARAVGIPHDAFDSNPIALDLLLRSVNGVLFTGGGLDLSDVGSPYYRTGNHIFKQVQAFNDAGIHYPLQGHCMGFEFLAILAAQGNSSVLLDNHFDSESLSLPLEWAEDANQTAWVKSMPADVHETFSRENSTWNHHHDGVTPSTFFTNPLLPDFFSVISTNHDRRNQEFISTMEAKSYPIRGLQWHPERIFEWRPDWNVDHSARAVAANAWTSSFFVGEARRNRPHKRSPELLARFTTFGMARERVGELLEGMEELHFPGFDELPAVMV